MHENFDEQQGTEALRNASELYDQYVQLAQLAQFTSETEEQEVLISYPHSFDHPLGLVITTE